MFEMSDNGYSTEKNVGNVLWSKCRSTWFPEGHVMPFLKVGRPEARGLTNPHPHRATEHDATPQRALSPRPRRHTITSTL